MGQTIYSVFAEIEKSHFSFFLFDFLLFIHLQRMCEGCRGEDANKIDEECGVKIPVERVKSAEVFLFPPSLFPPPKSTYGWEVLEILRELGVCSLAFGG